MANCRAEEATSNRHRIKRFGHLRFAFLTGSPTPWPWIQREIEVPIAFGHPRTYGADKHHLSW
jgi:hypothetical protein